MRGELTLQETMDMSTDRLQNEWMNARSEFLTEVLLKD
jgi:hypothetical protein